MWCCGQATKPTSGASLEGGWAAARDWRTWYLGTVCLLEAVIKNAIMYYCPLIIASLVGRYSAGNDAASARSLLSAVRVHTWEGPDLCSFTREMTE